MNGPIKMYSSRKIVNHDLPVKLPDVMYKLKNIHSSRNGMVEKSGDHVTSPGKKVDIIAQVKQFLKNNHKIPGMADLEARQEEILRQLADLKKQILSIKSELNVPNNTCSKPSTTSKRQVNHIPDLVMNASPTQPPYSLAIVQKLLEDEISLIVTSHVHSTVTSMPKNAEALTNTLVNFKPKENVPTVGVRLIWKNIDANTELLVSHIPILGEVNLLRYIARVTSSKLSYDCDQDCFTIDSILDQCYMLARARTKTERSSIFQNLNKSLGKGQFLVGKDRIGVADIAAYSAIKQCSSVNELGAFLGKWYNRCEAVA